MRSRSVRRVELAVPAHDHGAVRVAVWGLHPRVTFLARAQVDDPVSAGGPEQVPFKLFFYGKG